MGAAKLIWPDCGQRKKAQRKARDRARMIFFGIADHLLQRCEFGIAGWRPFRSGLSTAPSFSAGSWATIPLAMAKTKVAEIR